ncbi:MAG: M20/M25/M40 family metallo-hydrolase [Anaerolineales bacterium]|nr:M20/M25/M40 family metallo-hydrolase [Anaerolineales bacterium]
MTNKPFIIFLILVIGTLACSLTAEAPPTIPPRTPMSTITPQGPVEPAATVLQPSPLPDSGGVPTQGPPALPTGITPQVPTNPTLLAQLELVESNRLLNTVDALVTFQNRHAMSEPSPSKGVYAARDYLLAEFYKIQTEHPEARIGVFPHQFSFPFNGGDVLADNVVMFINGTDGEAGIIMIGAHYDTVASADITNGTSYQPGANDNGSGVAVVLELARILAEQPHRATIMFVLFAGEELGKYGSNAFLTDYIQANNIQLKAMLNLDIVGSPTGPNGERYDNQMRVYSAPPNESVSRQMARQIEFASQYFVQDMTVNVQKTIDRPGRWSDHETFSEAGFPAIRLIEQEDDASRTHNTRDNTDDIDGAYMRRVTQVTLASLLILADGPNAPTNISIDTTNWRMEWLPSRGATRYLIALRYPGSLVYDQVIPSQVTSFTWPGLSNFEAFAVAAIDEKGQIGAFSPECIIPVGSGVSGNFSC